MKVDNRLQTSIATGRFTLPVVTLICLMLWIISLDSWRDLGTLFIVICTGYLMIEFNTAFTLIRTRTTLFVSLFLYLFSSLFFLHDFQLNSFIPLAFILALYQLCSSYESPHASSYLFHAFLFLSIGSLCFPPLFYLIPLVVLGAFSFQALSIKSFFAGLLGIIAPYWILFCYAFFVDQMSLFYGPVHELVNFKTIDYSCIPVNVWISWGYVTLLQLIGSVHYLMVAYQDKTRPRSYMTFLMVAGCYILCVVLLQPHHLYPFLSVQLIFTSFLMTHLFTLTRNRFSGIFFIVTFVSMIALTCYNLWMLLFNF